MKENNLSRENWARRSRPPFLWKVFFADNPAELWCGSATQRCRAGCRRQVTSCYFRVAHRNHGKEAEQCPQVEMWCKGGKGGKKLGMETRFWKGQQDPWERKINYVYPTLSMDGMWPLLILSKGSWEEWKWSCNVESCLMLWHLNSLPLSLPGGTYNIRKRRDRQSAWGSTMLRSQAMAPWELPFLLLLLLLLLHRPETGGWTLPAGQREGEQEAKSGRMPPWESVGLSTGRSLDVCQRHLYQTRCRESKNSHYNRGAGRTVTWI